MKADQLSQSAAFIAIKFYGLTRQKKFRVLFDDETIRYYERIVRALPAPLCYYHYWLQFRWVRSLYIKFEELLLPGDLLHILIRKWYIGRMVNQLRSEGYEQLLVLGSGFDHLGLQHAKLGLSSVELDTPRMAQLKNKFLKQHYPSEPQPDIHPLHLGRQPLAAWLRQQQGLSAEKKTIIIAEGFFDYMDQQAVETTLAAIRSYFNEPALVSTHFSLDELSPLYRFVFRSSLQMVDEKLKFRASMNEFKTLLHAHDFHIATFLSPQKLHQHFCSNIDTHLPVLNGFYIFSAR